MRWCLVHVVIGAIALAPAATAQSGGPSLNLTAAQVVANVQTLNAGTRNLSATFTQQYLVHAFNTTKTSNGSVAVSGVSVDWSYLSPTGLRIVSNGTSECVYDPTRASVYLRDVDQSQYAVIGLLAQTNFAGSFTFDLVPGLTVAMPGAYALVGTPVKPTSAYTKVIIFVDAQTFEIHRVMFLDGQQNRNTFDFTYVQRNAPNPSATFVIHPPANATFSAQHGKTSAVPLTCP